MYNGHSCTLVCPEPGNVGDTTEREREQIWECLLLSTCGVLHKSRRQVLTLDLAKHPSHSFPSVPTNPSPDPGTPGAAPPGPHRGGTNTRFSCLRVYFMSKFVKVLERIYRQNIWFLKTELPEKEKQTWQLCKCTFIEFAVLLAPGS